MFPVLAVLAVGAGLSLTGGEPEPGSFTEQESGSESFLYALQDSAGTTVYRYLPGEQPTAVFSDHETAISIHDLELATRLALTADGRLFAYARPRTPGEADFFPRGQTVLRRERYRTYVYELTTDGSNKARKIAEVLGTQSPRRFLVSPRGDHVAYFNVEWERDDQGTVREYHWLYVHDTRTGDLAWQVDAGLRGYDHFRGAAWLDQFRIYLWRLPVVEVHLAPDQDLSKAVGPHVIDVRTGVATPIEATGFMAMLDEGQQSREDAAPECNTALDGRTLACISSSSAYQSDAGCHTVLRTRNAYTIDLGESRPIPVFSASSSCADRWYLSPSNSYVVGVETRVEDYALAGRRMFLYDTSQPGSEPTLMVGTDSWEPSLHPVGWTGG